MMNILKTMADLRYKYSENRQKSRLLFFVSLQLQNILDPAFQAVTDLGKRMKIHSYHFIFAVIIQLCPLQSAGIAKLCLADTLFGQNPLQLNPDLAHNLTIPFLCSVYLHFS